MKKLLLFLFMIIPIFCFSQNFSNSFTKVETVSFITKIIKPKGNTGSLSSVGTKVSYTENYYDITTRIKYDLNLADVKIKKSVSKVVLECKSGKCILKNTASHDKKEEEHISSLEFNTDSPTELYKAFLHLKTVVGL
ncbi:MAG: hypothetical protein U9R42_08375 [Bacteroidota bacterium]|nr:hypothetical protein [Bacteroidota bacterium]